MMIREKVESTAIHAIEYKSKSKLLSIAFNSNKGRMYDYPEVPAEKVVDFLRAESKGRYYHQHLKRYADKEAIK